MHMALARGFKDFEADQIRKYIGKKQIDKLSVYRQRWIEASDETSWDLVVNSGLYAFPKAYYNILHLLKLVLCILHLQVLILQF